MINYKFIEYNDANDYSASGYFNLGKGKQNDTFFYSQGLYLRYHAYDDLYEIGLYDQDRIDEVREFIHNNSVGYTIIDDTIGCKLAGEAEARESAFEEGGIYIYAGADLVSIELLDPEYFFEVLQMPIYSPEEEQEFKSAFDANMKVTIADDSLLELLMEFCDEYPDIVIRNNDSESPYGFYYDNEFIIPRKMFKIRIHAYDDANKAILING